MYISSLKSRSAVWLVLLVAFVATIYPACAMAQDLPTELPSGAKAVEELLREQIEPFGRPSLITQAIALSFLALLPFIIMILTSFVKIVVVLSLLRSALGVQQAPPNQIINGIAFLLSLYVMYPHCHQDV